MISASVTPSQEQIHQQLEIDLYDPFAAPKLEKSYAQYLHAEGLTSLAIKIDDCEKHVVMHKDASGHIWPIPISSCNKGSCFRCAIRRADIEFQKYRALAPLLFESFTTFEIAYEVAAKARKILGRIKFHDGKKRSLASKVGWRSRRACKMLWLGMVQSIPSAVVNKLRALDPNIIIRSYAKSRFEDILRRVVAPDIPVDHVERLWLEKVPRRFTFQGMNQEDRRKLFTKDDSTPLVNNFASDGEHQPHCRVYLCPKCNKPSICHTQRVHPGVPASDYQWTYTSPPG